MLQVILIYLRRFAWVFLPTCFISIVFVPFIVNLLDMILWPEVVDHDSIYIYCAVIPCILALLYVFYCRHYVNREDLLMFLRHRVRCKKKCIVHYFTLSGLLVNLIYKRHIDPKLVDIYSLDLIREFAPNANIGPVLERISGNAAQGGRNFDDKAWADYSRLARYISFIQPVEKEFNLDISLKDAMLDTDHSELNKQTLARKSFLKALSLSPEEAETQFVQELAFFKRVTRLYGHHVSEFLLVCLLRTLMYASRDPVQCQVEDLLSKLWVRKLGLAFTPNFQELTPSYTNEFFVTLYQDRINIRQFYREQDFWKFDDDDDDETGFEEQSMAQGFQTRNSGSVYSHGNEVFFKHAASGGASAESTAFAAAKSSQSAEKAAQAASSRYSYALQLVKDKLSKAQDENIGHTEQSHDVPKAKPFQGYAYSFTAHLEPNDADDLFGLNGAHGKDTGSVAIGTESSSISCPCVGSCFCLGRGEQAAQPNQGEQSNEARTKAFSTSIQEESAQSLAQSEDTSSINLSEGYLSLDSDNSLASLAVSEGKVKAAEPEAYEQQNAQTTQDELSLPKEEGSALSLSKQQRLAQERAEARAAARSGISKMQVPQAIEMSRAEASTLERQAAKQEKRLSKLNAELQHPLYKAVGDSGLVVLDKHTSDEGVVNYTLGVKDGANASSHIAYSFKSGKQDNSSGATQDGAEAFSLLQADDLKSLDSNSAILTLDHKGNVTFISDEKTPVFDQEYVRKEHVFKSMKRPPEAKVKTGAGDGTHYSYRDSYRQAYEEAFATYQKLNQDKTGNLQSDLGGAEERSKSEPIDESTQHQLKSILRDKDMHSGANTDLASHTLEVASELADLGSQHNGAQVSAGVGTMDNSSSEVPVIKSARMERIQNLFNPQREDMPWTHNQATQSKATEEDKSTEPKTLEDYRKIIKEAVAAKKRGEFLSEVGAPSTPSYSMAVNSRFIEPIEQGQMGGVLGVTDDGFYVGSMAVKGQSGAAMAVEKTPEEMRKRAFAVLELEETATVEQIKAQYIGLAKCYNPEVIHDYEGMSEHQKYLLYNRLMSIRDAYEYLMEQSGELV